MHSLTKCLTMFVVSFPHHSQGRVEDVTRTRGIRPVADKVEFLLVGPVLGRMLMECSVDWVSIMFLALKGRNWKKWLRGMERHIAIPCRDGSLCKKGNTRPWYPTIEQMVETFTWSHSEGCRRNFGDWKAQIALNVSSWLPNASPSILGGWKPTEIGIHCAEFSTYLKAQISSLPFMYLFLICCDYVVLFFI